MKFEDLTKEQKEAYRNWLSDRIIFSSSDHSYNCPECGLLNALSDLDGEVDAYELTVITCLECEKDIQILRHPDYGIHTKKCKSSVSDWLTEVCENE